MALKPVFGVWDQARRSLACSATESIWYIGIFSCCNLLTWKLSSMSKSYVFLIGVWDCLSLVWIFFVYEILLLSLFFVSTHILLEPVNFMFIYRFIKRTVKISNFKLFPFTRLHSEWLKQLTIKVLIGLKVSPVSTLLMPSADRLCKQFEPRSGPTKCWAWSGSKRFDTVMAFMSNFLKIIFLYFWRRKKISRLQKSMQNYPACKELIWNCA